LNRLQRREQKGILGRFVIREQGAGKLEMGRRKPIEGER
jgi:hypothetical protein